MAGLFVRLKLRLLANGLRGGGVRLIGLVLGGLWGLSLAVLGFSGLAILRLHRDVDAAVAVAGFSGLFLAWVLLPIVAFSSDETLDPARLAHLPLSRRQLASGLLAASLVGIPAICTAAALSGALVGFARGPAGTLLVLASIVTDLCLCVVASRAVTTALSGLLRSRRGRDVSVLVFSLLGVAYWGLRAAGASLVHRVGRSGLLTLGHVLRWAPPGLAGHALADAQRGRLGFAAAEVGAAAIVVLLLARWWAGSIERALVSADSPLEQHHGGLADLFPRPWAALLPRTGLGAVAAKELRSFWRDPRRRAQWVSTVAIGCGLPLWVVLRGTATHPSAVLAAVAVAGLAGLSGMNQLGYDGSAMWMNVIAGNDMRGDLAGRNVATLAITLPLVVLDAVVLATVEGGWGYVALAICLALGGLGVLFAIGDVVSVRAPVPLPESRTNAWASGASGRGCLAGLLQLVAMAVGGVLLLPVLVLVAVGLGSWPPALAVAAVVAPVYGAFIWRVGLGIAARDVYWRQPELLAALSPKRT